MLIAGKQLQPGSVADDRLATPGGRPSTLNKAMTALATAVDFDPACATTIAATPKGTVQVQVNGLTQNLGDAVKTADCYFSVDNGVTARAISAIVAGDKLFWVGTVSGFQLAVTDKVSFLYNA